LDPDPYWSPTASSGSGSGKNEYGSTTLVVDPDLGLLQNANRSYKTGPIGQFLSRTKNIYKSEKFILRTLFHSSLRPPLTSKLPEKPLGPG
jgi:hypothetical protein